MAKDLGMLVVSLLVAASAVVMGTALNQNYQPTPSFTSEDQCLSASAQPALKHYFQPGTTVETGATFGIEGKN